MRAIDGTHIPNIRPQDSGADYFNHKKYSIVVQGTCDFQGIFLDAYIGWPDKVHDTRVLANLSLCTKMNNRTLVPNWSIPLGSYPVQVPLVILGDPAYPLLRDEALSKTMN